MNKSIVVIEDDVDLRDYIKGLFLEAGYVVHTAGDGAEALKLVERVEPEVVVLDLGLPTIKGDTVCIEIKKNHPHIPVIILTARDATSDVVHGLGLGADDYITKPFEGDELLARVKARLRHQQIDDEKLVVDDLTLHTRSLEVKRGDRDIQLTSQEFKILEYLMANKGRVMTREMIISRLWRTNPDVETRVIDVYIGYLRKKIDADHDKKLIQSVRGFGYKIAE
jgi:DNA-binding response OmpR family regulator